MKKNKPEKVFYIIEVSSMEKITQEIVKLCLCEDCKEGYTYCGVNMVCERVKNKVKEIPVAEVVSAIKETNEV